MSVIPLQFAIDGTWITAASDGGLGSLGQRYLCYFTSSEGKTSKKLLLRFQEWPQSGLTVVPLDLEAVADSRIKDIRPVLIKEYHRTATQPTGKTGTAPCTVLQQDVTGLVSLKDAILSAVKKGKLYRIGRLFLASCRILDRFTKSFPLDKAVPLQCPGSLAVGSSYRVVPLDAEIRLRTQFNNAPEVKQLFSACSVNRPATALPTGMMPLEYTVSP